MDGKSIHDLDSILAEFHPIRSKQTRVYIILLFQRRHLNFPGVVDSTLFRFFQGPNTVTLPGDGCGVTSLKRLTDSGAKRGRAH